MVCSDQKLSGACHLAFIASETQMTAGKGSKIIAQIF